MLRNFADDPLWRVPCQLLFRLCVSPVLHHTGAQAQAGVGMQVISLVTAGIACVAGATELTKLPAGKLDATLLKDAGAKDGTTV